MQSRQWSSWPLSGPQYNRCFDCFALNHRSCISAYGTRRSHNRRVFRFPESLIFPNCWNAFHCIIFESLTSCTDMSLKWWKKPSQLYTCVLNLDVATACVLLERCATWWTATRAMSLCRVVLFTMGRTLSIMGPLDYQTVVQAVLMRGGE